MPLVLNDSMTDSQILTAIAETYGSPSSWEMREKDYGTRSIDRLPWASEDRGLYARIGLGIIADRARGATRGTSHETF